MCRDTAYSAGIGVAAILLDPIFQGLAISPLVGLASPALLTVLVIPVNCAMLPDDDLVLR